jgi:tight adherence protein C
VLAAALIGSTLPNFYLDQRRGRRQAQLMDGLPDALDLLVACTEAGLSLNAALERVVEQLPDSQPELAQELGQVNAEVRAGVDRTVALRNLAERTGLEEVRGLMSLIAHSVRLGTGIAGTLRVYSEEFRDRRMRRAEEMAATIGTKLIFPLVLCLFPSFFVVAIGPAMIGLMRALSAGH